MTLPLDSAGAETDPAVGERDDAVRSAELGDEVRRADAIQAAVDSSLHAAAGDRLQVLDRSLIEIGQERSSQRMLGRSLEQRGDVQALVVAEACERDALGDSQLAARQRAGLVEDDAIDFRQAFERIRIGQQNAVTSQVGRCRSERRRHGDSEGARARDHEHGQRGSECLRRIDRQPCGTSDPGANQHIAEKPGGGGIGIAGHRRLIGLGSLHERDDMR